MLIIHLNRYNKLLYVIDTCQANTMYSKFYSPEIIATGSSSLGESSYSVRLPPLVWSEGSADEE